MSNAIRLHKTKHPDPAARARFDGLVGIDQQKADLLEHLMRAIAPERLQLWVKKHHAKGLAAARRIESRPPLVILGGEVGCGKTELATSIGSVIASALDEQIIALETPSDIRGGGLVGELSERVTAAFSEARAELGRHRGLLIIDEGDDLATSRAQMQAHHEDRAGLNVLIKEIDRLARDSVRLAVVLVSNRLNALDPAILRRATTIRFTRPDANARRVLFSRLLEGLDLTDGDLEALVRTSERTPPFSYSDLVQRGVEAALVASMRADRPFSAATLRETIEHLEPSPLIDDTTV